MYIYKRRISTFCFTAINKFTLEVSAQFGSKKLYNKNYQNYQIFFELHQLFIHYFLYNTVSLFPLLILLTRRITKTNFHHGRIVLFLCSHLLACANFVILKYAMLQSLILCINTFKCFTFFKSITPNHKSNKIIISGSSSSKLTSSKLILLRSTLRMLVSSLEKVASHH